MSPDGELLPGTASVDSIRCGLARRVFKLHFVPWWLVHRPVLRHKAATDVRIDLQEATVWALNRLSSDLSWRESSFSETFGAARASRPRVLSLARSGAVFQLFRLPLVEHLLNGDCPEFVERKPLDVVQVDAQRAYDRDDFEAARQLAQSVVYRWSTAPSALEDEVDRALKTGVLSPEVHAAASAAFDPVLVRAILLLVRLEMRTISNPRSRLLDLVEALRCTAGFELECSYLISVIYTRSADPAAARGHLALGRPRGRGEEGYNADAEMRWTHLECTLGEDSDEKTNRTLRLLLEHLDLVAARRAQAVGDCLRFSADFAEFLVREVRLEDAQVLLGRACAVQAADPDFLSPVASSYLHRANGHLSMARGDLPGARVWMDHAITQAKRDPAWHRAEVRALEAYLELLYRARSAGLVWANEHEIAKTKTALFKLKLAKKGNL